MKENDYDEDDPRFIPYVKSDNVDKKIIPFTVNKAAMAERLHMMDDEVNEVCSDNMVGSRSYLLSGISCRCPVY